MKRILIKKVGDFETDIDNKVRDFVTDIDKKSFGYETDIDNKLEAMKRILIIK